MDIQIFTKFDLPSEMNIQIYDYFALSPPPEDLATSEKRTADEAPDDEPPTKRREKKRYKMNPVKIKKGVEALVERYQLDQVQKENLESVAELTHFVPSVDLVEWVATEARLRDDTNSELNICMFAYMEFFPWFLEPMGGSFRLSLGEYNGSSPRRWFGVLKGYRHGFSEVTYRNSHWDIDEGQKFSRIIFENRRQVDWFASFKHLFQLHKMMPEHSLHNRYLWRSTQKERRLVRLTLLFTSLTP